MLPQQVPRGKRQYIVLLHQPRRQRSLARSWLPKHQHPQHLAFAGPIRPRAPVSHRRPGVAVERERQRLLCGRRSSERTPLYELRSCDLVEEVLRALGECGTTRAKARDNGDGHEDGEDEDQEGGRDQRTLALGHAPRTRVGVSQYEYQSVVSTLGDCRFAPNVNHTTTKWFGGLTETENPDPVTVL